MRFPSLTALADRATAVARRFPWTLAAAAVAATAAIIASKNQDDIFWVRATFVAALALPLTVALTLVAEVRRWQPLRRTGALLIGVLALVLFFRSWPTIDAPQHAIRYFQLAVALHLVVAFLPLLGNRNTTAFWQYNRRLFLGFLRAVVFSGVLFVGLAIALGALDRLFGVAVSNDSYLHVWFVLAFVGNSWIFLATVPEDVAALAHDREYPRALKVFAQYILTPLAFGYLLILLAYLIKIVAGGEWPNGWIGWLVASVAVTGMLGFLLVEPLRADPEEGWIRIYARGLFLGLIPAALMLLVAFWKRIEPYGLTEPRTLGLLLGFWLLGIAVLFAVRPATSIKTIPVALALLLLLTLYGPLSVTQLSIGSQGRRFAAMLRAGSANDGPAEASAALRFLIDHHADAEIAARLGKPLPMIAWDSVSQRGAGRDLLGVRLMALAGATYQREGTPRLSKAGDFSIGSDRGTAVSIAGFAWLLPLNSNVSTSALAGSDSVRVLEGRDHGLVNILVGRDTLHFDLRPLVQRYRDSLPAAGAAPESWFRMVALPGPRRGELVLQQLNGKQAADTLRISYWNGRLLLGER